MFGMSNQQSPAHVCGLYYNVPFGGWRLEKQYLPQVQLEAHATILATTSRTLLTQTFANPSIDKGIKECRYTFPLYDGVSVVGFTCHVGEREIVGEVKEKEKARAVFEKAVARGETAGLFEQLPDASDVFTTTVGNIPPGAKIVIRITYLGELKHDLEVDGIRFTIPTIIFPRYGNYPGALLRSSATDAMGSSISVTVDVEMADGTFIQKMQSPTHPIAMTMGTTSRAPNTEPAMTKASATLTLGNAGLEIDFVLQVIAKDTGVPKAILENHPAIPDQRALMATLVPKFSLPPEMPEIVFVCDRSGSMGGIRIELAKQALKVFLKSLPIGVKFNICSFGRQHTFLWPRSVTYSQQTLDEAMAHADSLAANYGGTEMLQPLKATIEQRYKDMSLEIMMLTDGETWDQQALFSYLNLSITESKAPIRVFTLGIGNGVSHALIEGIAKAGDGFSQTVGEGEKMDTKVVRMLKGALSPHINDYTLEVKYNNDDVSAYLDVEEEDNYEVVEKVADILKVKLGLEEEKNVSEKAKKPIYLFNPSTDPDQEVPSVHDETGEQRYAHLPKVFAPKIIQAPQRIPSLFAFNRATVYLLLGPEAPQGTPKSVILRGTSAHGPLVLEIPIQILDAPGETINQLAAKKAISELEQGRGWLAEARDGSNVLIKTKHEGRFADMVEREAVRLGVQFQVGGKWCSFVAVESNKNEAQEQGNYKGWEWLEDESCDAAQPQKAQIQNAPNGINCRAKVVRSAPPSANSPNPFGKLPQFAAPTQKLGSPVAGQGQNNNGGPLFGPARSRGVLFGASSASGGSTPFGGTNTNSGGLFGAFSKSQNSASQSGGSSLPANNGSTFGVLGQSSKGLFGAPSQSGSSLFGAPSQNQNSGGTSLDSVSIQPTGLATQSGRSDRQDYQSDLMILEQQNKNRRTLTSQSTDSIIQQAVQAAPTAPLSSEALIHYLISLQTFAGSWAFTSDLLISLGLNEKQVEEQMESMESMESMNETVFATALVVVVFEERLAEWKGSWELVIDKARGWLEGGVGEEGTDGYFSRARRLLK